MVSHICAVPGEFFMQKGDGLRVFLG